MKNNTLEFFKVEDNDKEININSIYLHIDNRQGTLLEVFDEIIKWYVLCAHGAYRLGKLEI